MFWQVLLTHFLNVQHVTNQLVSVKFVILLQMSKISVKKWNESPYYEETTWLDLMTHFFNVQYVTNQLVSVKFGFLLHLSKTPVKKWNERPNFEEISWLDLMIHFLKPNSWSVSNLLFCFISLRSLSKHEMKVKTLKKSLGWIWWRLLKVN